jgi:hypothetical protein
VNKTVQNFLSGFVFILVANAGLTVQNSYALKGPDNLNPILNPIYKIKVTFDSITIHHDRDDYSDGEFDLSAFVQGKRVDLTGATRDSCIRYEYNSITKALEKKTYLCERLYDAHEGETYSFNPDTEVTVDLRATVPLSIFTVGHEVDRCGRVDWPGVDDPVMQNLVTALNQPSAPVKSKAISDFVHVIESQASCFNEKLILPHNDMLRASQIYYDATEYGAGSHEEKGYDNDYTLRYTITVTPPQPRDQTGVIAPLEEVGCNNQLPLSSVTSSGNQLNFPPSNAIDNNLNTKWWSTIIINPFITLDLGATESVCFVDIAFADGALHKYRFDISVSLDGTSFTNVFSGTSSGTTSSPETYQHHFHQSQARYVKITITESTPGAPRSIAEISEIDLFGAQHQF